MTISRVLPTLIKLKCVIKLNSIPKTQLLNPAKLSVIKHCPGAFRVIEKRMMSTDIEKELNDPKRHFDYQQLIAKKDQENVVIIDVREHAEINETGKIPGSIHIPLNKLNHALSVLSSEEFLKLYDLKKPKMDDEIIFTCRSGRRSVTAMKYALNSGFINAGNYKGGWLDWAEKTALSK